MLVNAREFNLSESHRLSQSGITLLLFALVCASGLMIPFLTAGPLTLDEHGSYWIVESDVPSTTLARSLNYAAIPPLSGWLQQFCLAVGGHHEMAFRMSSAAPFVMSIIVTYLLMRDLSNSHVAGLAALILAWHPESMDEVRIARCYGLVILLSAFSFWMTIRWARSPSSWAYMFGWALSGAALLWTHYLTAPVMALELLVLIGFLKLDATRPPRAWKPLLVGVGLLVVAGIPLIPSVQRMADWNTALGFGQQPASLWSLLGPIWIVGTITGLIVSWGLSRVASGTVGSDQPNAADTRQRMITLIVWGIAPILLMAIVTNCGLAGLNNPRYRTAFAVPGACCLAFLLSHRSRPWAALAGTIGLLAAAWLMLPNRPWQPTRVAGAERQDWRRIAMEIEQNSEPGETVFVQSGLSESFLVPIYCDDALFMDYVACRVGKFYLRSSHPRLALPFLWADPSPMTQRFRDILKTNAALNQTIWIACATDTDLCRDSLPWMDRLLTQAGYQVHTRSTFQTAELVRYEVAK